MMSDGLKVPDGFEIERWPDGSPKMVNTNTCECPWMDLDGKSHPGCVYGIHGALGYWRIALKKKPGRKLLTFREAVYEASMGRRIFRDGVYQFGPSDDLCKSFILGAIDRTDFYTEETP